MRQIVRRAAASGSRLSTPAVLAISIVVLVAVRLVLLSTTYAGGDEAGFLMVGTGWHDGPSLYGHYWVDRPPLLIWLNELAGGLHTLRLLGLVASVLTVLGIAWAAHLTRGRSAAQWAASAAVVLNCAQWLGIARVNGEMLAGPFVAWSIALTAYAVLRTGPWRVPAACGAGALATCGLAVKQSVAEAFVFALALILAVAIVKPQGRRAALQVLAAGAAGSILAGGIVLAAAASRGTSPSELIDAVVTFRAEAGEVIRTSASGATPRRLLAMLGTWAVSGLGAATTLVVWQAVRRRDPLLLATAATLLYGLVVALFGGSYWAHYLIQLIPAASLAVGLLAGRVPTVLLRRVAAVTLLATIVNATWAAFQTDHNARQHTVGTWLRDAGEPGDTAVVAYGQPNVLFEAEMASPYRYLWSLPVRTRDPDLTELTSVLSSPQRPAWVVDWSGLETWGVESAQAVAELRRGYRRAAVVCDARVWLARTEERTIPHVPEVCP